MELRAELQRGQFYRKGEDIVKLMIRAGDHLFVDRMTYNFRQPKRGEIIVFETKGIPEDKRMTNLAHWSIPPDQFYIKRLVGLGGERVQIGDDRHLDHQRQAPRRLDTAFRERLFLRPQGATARQPLLGPRQFPYSYRCFQDNSATYTVSPNHYMVMGDNTMNSLDSRSWGEFPSTNVIGKSFFVYWPITDRFGLGCLNH